MTESSAFIDALLGLALPTGGWGYWTGQAIHFEPTCLAILALAAERDKHRAAIDQAVAALDAQSDSTGLYRLDRGRPQAIWASALVATTKHALGLDISHTAKRLLDIRGRTIKGDPEVQDMMDIDSERVGWPWAEGTFAWVEPTSWAVLALRAAGFGNHSRVIEGVKLLLDRAFDSGGVNYGNRRVLGAMTEPIPGPTAQMLLAIQGHDEPRVVAARRYLANTVAPMTDLEHLGWARLALACHAHDSAAANVLPQLDEQMRRAYSAQTSDGRPVSVVRHALTALALGSDRFHPFRLTGDAARRVPSEGEVVPPAKPEDPPRPGLFEAIKGRFRNIVVRGLGALRQPPEFGAIHVGRAESYDGDLLSLLKSQFAHYRPHVAVSGRRVVLKPNLVEYRRAQVINTDPRLIDAVIQLFKQEGAAEIVVAEGPGHWRNVEFLVEESGLGAILRKHGVRFVDLNHDEPVKVPNLGRTTGLDHLYLTRTVMNAEVFVSLPKMKTHHWAGATLSLKNLFGTLPGICYGWPKNELHWRGIPQSIIDIALTQTPHLAIVDGIIGMEGDGPLVGKSRHSGVIVMGIDLVAVDATCCRLMGLPADRIPTLALGAHMKLGRLAKDAIQQIGEPIEKWAQDYEQPPKFANLLIAEKQVA